MKKIVKIKESELVNLIDKIITESTKGVKTKNTVSKRKPIVNEETKLRTMVKQIIKEQENEYATAWQEKRNQSKYSYDEEPMSSEIDDVRWDLSPKERLVLFKKDMDNLVNRIYSSQQLVSYGEELEWIYDTIENYKKYIMRLKNEQDHGFDWESSE
jgi:hypothetical protein